MLYIPIPGEFVPAYLDRAGDEVRLIDGLSLCLTSGLPAPFQRHAAQHRRFA
jgi:hypothetical protein